MSNNHSEKNSTDRLIELLQSGGEQSNSDELLADLNEREVDEFNAARQAMVLLEMANPARENSSLSSRQIEIDTAAVQDAPTPAVGANMNRGVLPEIQILGHYKILETVGQGGFGVVVKARDTKLGRIVALKIPRIDSMLQGQESRDRFAREARLVAMLSHPAIVPVYETGAEGPLLFIASSYCDGGSLAQWVSRQTNTIAPTLSAKIVARLAEAVQHAHARGVVHRDLKPGNVLLDFDQSTADQDDQSFVDALRVTDFGMARFLSDDQSLTQAGAAIGTPAYMSPEQARGDVDGTGPISDVYALGAILYELLTGRPPIIEESNIATMRAIENQKPVSPRILNPDVPRDLSAVCLKCLEKDPRHRYDDAQELQDELADYLDGKPVKARPVNWGTRLIGWSKRNRVIASALAVAFAGLAIGLVFSISYGVSANRAREFANTKSAEALNQVKLARKAVDDLQRAIAEEPLLKSKGMQSFRKKLLDSANQYYQLVSKQRPDDRDVLREYLEILKGLAFLNAELGDRTRAISILRDTINLQETEFPLDVADVAATKLILANNLGKVRRHDDAILEATSAVEALQALTEEKSDSIERQNQLIKGLSQLSTSQSLKGNHEDAEANADKALLIASDLNGEPPSSWPVSHLLATVLERKTHTALALQKHDEVDQFAPLAIQMWHRVSDAEPDSRADYLHPVATLHSLHGASYNVRHLHEQALQHFEFERRMLDELIELQPEVAANHAQSANQLLRYAKCLYESGDVVGARQTLALNMPQTLDALERFPEENVLYVTMVLCYQLSAKTFRAGGDLETATVELAKGIELCERLCESDQAAAQIQVILSTLYLEQSTYYLQQKMYSDAAAECKRALDVLEDLYRQEPAGQHVGQLEFAYMLYGNVMNKLGQYEDFLDATKVIADWPHESKNIRKARIHRISALVHVGRSDEARADFARVSKTVIGNQENLNMAGLASKCAHVIGKSNGTGTPNDDYQYFVSQSVRFLESARASGLLNDESAVKLLKEHPDFSELRQTEAYSRIVQ